MDQITHSKSGAVVFEGSAIEVFRLTVIAHGLETYAKFGRKLNSAYTPSAMLRVATEATGKTYKRRQYMEAATDLREAVAVMRSNITTVQE